MADNLPIAKEQFLNSIPNFIAKHKRLPYLQEDDVLVEAKNDYGEIEARPYRASRYISAFYGSQDKMTEALFNKEILTYELIAATLGLTETLVCNAIEKETKNPQLEVRRGLHIFFNKDFYEDNLDKHHSTCENCKNTCKQEYWVGLSCRKFVDKEK